MILNYNTITFKLQRCYVALNNNVKTIMIGEKARIWKEGAMVYFQVLSGENKENHGKSIRIAGNLVEIQTRYFENVSPEHYCSTNLSNTNNIANICFIIIII